MSHAPQGVEVQIGTRIFPLFWVFKALWTGRAFPINATCMVTCDHVAKNARPKNFRFPDYPNLPPVKKVIRIESNNGVDMAIIVFTAPHGLTPVTLAAQNPASGTPIAFTDRYGYLRKGTVHGYFSHTDMLQAIIDAGIVSRPSAKLLKDMRKLNCKDLLCDLRTQSGDSGSPVYNEQGEVIGMLFASSKITYQTMLVPVEVLREYINSHLADLSYTLTC